jgi:IMP dehydrogenase
MINTNKKLLSYDDVLLIPQYSDIKSRSEIDTSVTFKKNNKSIKLDIPIISSPMSTVTEAYMCNAIRNLGGLGIIHRYNTINFQTKLCSFVNDSETKSAAIGVSGDYKERLESLYNEGLKIVCLDVAHGDHILVKDAIDFINNKYPSLFIIAGNVSTSSAYERLSNWGADAIRVSVGSGSICTTRIQTGHGVPTLQAVLDCYDKKNELENPAYIIADGGMKNSGDIVKSLAAGADIVMLGSMLSGTKEAPGKVIINDEGNKVKKYSGMASKTAQKAWKGSYSSIEGISTYVNYKGTLYKVLNEIMANVRSGMSYSGARNLEELKSAQFAIQTQNSHIEGQPHIYRK